MKMNSMINFPEDVLMNKILPKLDAKSLGKLRCVCKNFQSFISSPAFVKIHCHEQFNNNPIIFLVSNHLSFFYSLNFKGTHIKPYCSRLLCSFKPVFFGSCNGLLCLVEENNSPPILWNPTTKEYRKLPPPLSPTETSFLSHSADIISFGYKHVQVYGLGYDSIINYKVIQCENIIYNQYIPQGGTEYAITNFQVYTLGGTDDTWRRINDDDNPYRSYSTTPYRYQTPGMFVNGALHWILSEKAFSGSKIIAFDIEKERFRAEVPKPHSNLSDWSLHVLKGCLCIYERLARKLSPRIDVWMMKDYGVIESWTKLFTIRDASASGDLDFKVLNFCKNGEVIVARNYDYSKDLFLYNPISKKCQIINGEIPWGISYTEIHIESLVSLNTCIYGKGMVW